MGRPPSNGGPAFRFNPTEVAEMETILHEHNTQVPSREVLQALADKFSNTVERSGKVEVQMKQVWNWFQNRRYAIRAKAAKTPMKLHVSSTPREVPTAVRNVSQVPQPVNVPAGGIAAVQSAGGTPPENTQMEFEAKSARDGAWYDVTYFLSHKSLETGDPFVLVRFAGFGPEEDEWVNVRKHVRQRSLPCESAECVAVLPGDLILCFQEGKEQALYYDAHVLDAQRRRHDMRGCRCRFLVRYDHDQSEEIVPLKKVCRRPETDYRLQQLHAMKESPSPKTGLDPHHSGNTLRVYPPSEPMQKLQKMEERTGVAAVRLPTTATESKVMPPQNASVCSGGNAEPQVSQPKSIEPSNAGKVETVVVPPSNMAMPSGTTATDTLTTTNEETSMTPPVNADQNIGVATANAESSVPAANIGATTSTVPTTANAETSLETQANSAMNIDATMSNVDTTVADTSMVPPADSAVNIGATSTVLTANAETPVASHPNIGDTTSTVPTVNAETSVAPPADSAMDVDATTSTVGAAIAATSDVPPVTSAANVDATTSPVDTGNAETSVVSLANSAVDVGAGTSTVAPDTMEPPCTAPPTNVEVPSGGDTTVVATGSDQNML